MSGIKRLFALLGILVSKQVMAIEASIKVDEDINDTLLNFFQMLILFAIGAFFGYHVGLILRIYIRLAFWGVVLYVISLIILQSLGVVKIETETIVKTIFVIIPFIKGLIEMNIFPKIVWWGIFFGFFVGFFYSDLMNIYRATAPKKEKEKKK